MVEMKSHSPGLEAWIGGHKDTTILGVVCGSQPEAEEKQPPWREENDHLQDYFKPEALYMLSPITLFSYFPHLFTHVKLGVKLFSIVPWSLRCFEWWILIGLVFDATLSVSCFVLCCSCIVFKWRKPMKIKAISVLSKEKKSLKRWEYIFENNITEFVLLG